MKSNNPKSRYHLNIRSNDYVLEVGGGHNPHSRSNVVVDKFLDSNYHRHDDIKVYKHQKLIQADGEKLPFKDNEFSYVMSNHVLEHTENPEAFLKEQMRVAKKGYIETPSIIGEYLFPKKSHRWLVLELDNKLVLMDKNKYWFKDGPDLGFLFLTWLQKTSLGYKMLMDTKPNFMTVRYEWNENIEFEINPTHEKYVQYFTGYWDEEMVKIFFPHKSNFHEFLNSIKSLSRIIKRSFYGKYVWKKQWI